MSEEVHVFLKRRDLPSEDVWQNAINEAHFAFILGPAFDPLTHRGFLPCQLRGKESGFEYYLDPKADIIATYPDVASIAAAFDWAASFRWGSRLDEAASALVAAAALAWQTAGILIDPQWNLRFDGYEALAYARDTYDARVRG